MNCDLEHVTAVAGSTVVLLARIKTSDGDYLTPDAVESVRVDVYDLSSGRVAVALDGTVIIDTTTPYDTPPAFEVIYAGLQTGTIWSRDSIGFNCKYKLTLPTPDTTYDVRLTIALNNGETVVAAYVIDTV